MRNILVGLLVALVVLFFPATALASLGVGIGTGKIEVKEELKNGGIYALPPVTVFNTGTEEAEYSMDVTLNETQPQLKPDPKWFSFSPDKFRLEPKKAQVVKPYINLPISTPPGDYFAYLEAHPSGTVQQGNTAVGVAAATKLSFTVKPTNIFYGIIFRIISLFKQFAPYSYITLVLIVLTILWRIIRKRLRLEVKLRRPEPAATKTKPEINKAKQTKTKKKPARKSNKKTPKGPKKKAK